MKGNNYDENFQLGDGEDELDFDLRCNDLSDLFVFT